MNTIRKVCGALLHSLKGEITIPGLLMIDTPGHAAFTNLRRRGGNLADIAILVIDINEGIKPQTLECIEILKHYKTPFVVAANKIDLIAGWKSDNTISLLQNIQSQNPEAVTAFETKLYTIVGRLHELGFSSERFDRVDDYTKQVAIIPVSAKTGEGIPELLMVLTGLAQRYLEKRLKINAEGNAKGTILEIKEEKGIGKTLDMVIYDGTLRVGDKIIIGGLEKPVITKVRALFQPKPLAEMRDPKAKFNSVQEAVAATGVKILAPDIDEVVAGMPVQSFEEENLEQVSAEIQKEIWEVMLKTDRNGIVIKADTLGSLEALSKILGEKNISIRVASVGEISKKDVMEAEANYGRDPLQAVILGFNVEAPDEIKNITAKVKIITHKIIYKLIEEFDFWQEEEKKRQEANELNTLVKPCKMQIMQGYVFRQSNPAVVGMEIIAGSIKTSVPVMNSEGRDISHVRGIQHEKENISEAKKGKQVAVSLDNVTVGRQIREGDILYSSIPEEDFRKLKKLAKYLEKDEIELLKEIAEVKRRQNPVWGV